VVTGGSGKCWCPLERLYMASTVQVAIPRYVIRSHFTASSATPPAHGWYQLSSGLHRKLNTAYVRHRGGKTRRSDDGRGAGGPLRHRTGERPDHRSGHLPLLAGAGGGAQVGQWQWLVEEATRRFVIEAIKRAATFQTEEKHRESDIMLS
jgi:hypothetical protein